MSLLTFNALAAFAVQSTVVALIALGLERLLPKDGVMSRLVLWWSVWATGIVIPLADAVSPRDSAGPRLIGDTVVFAIESISRSAPAQARITAVWAVVAGALLMAAWRIVGLVRLHWYVVQAEPLTPNHELACEISVVEYRLWVKAEYRVSDAVEGPLVYGWLHPVILLPEGFEDMPPAQRMGILAHELSHVRRRDWLKLLIEEAVRCLLWFTPAVHIALRRGRVAREMRADAVAVGITRDRDAYLNALVEIARRPIRGDALVAPLFLEPRSLKGRVAALLEDRPMSIMRNIAPMIALFLLMPAVGRWAQEAFPLRLQAAQTTVHKVGDGVKAPRLLNKVEPQYTDEAREAGLEGTVKLSIEVHPDGRAYNIQVVRGVGMGLDEQAALAIEQWTFAPGIKDGEPVVVAATVEVNFKLMADPESAPPARP